MADQTVSMISPDGKDVADVPVGQVEHFKSLGAKIVEPPPPMSVRGGIMHPLTSVINPELESARSALGAATATPRGTPILARSRTGTLYPSETGTGAVNAAKNVVKGAGGGLIDQAEGVTSPLALGTMGAAKGVNALAQSPATQAGIGRLMQMIGDFDLVHPFKSTVGQAGTALEQSANATREAALNAERYLPNKSGYPGGTSGAQTSHVSYATPTEATPVQGGLSAADKAMLARQNYSPEMIQRAEQDLIRSRSASPQGPTPASPSPQKWPVTPQVLPDSRIVPETGETQAAWRARVAAKIQSGGASPSGGSTPAQSTGTSFQPAPMPSRPPMTVAPESPMQPQAAPSSAASAPSPIRSIEGRPAPLYPSAGTVKGVTSNALEAASNQALAAGHWDEAERLIGQSLQSFFQGSGGPMAGILAAAIAHKARQVVEPLRADPSFQQATPAKQQQMIQQALRQPGARGSLTSLLGS